MFHFRILLVDDDEDDYLLMSAYLSEIGDCDACLDWAETYEDALRYFDQHATPGLLIVDYRLNGTRTGLDLVHTLIEDCPLLIAILVTAHEKSAVDSKRGFSDLKGYIRKNDLSPTLLAETIRPLMV